MILPAPFELGGVGITEPFFTRELLNNSKSFVHERVLWNAEHNYSLVGRSYDTVRFGVGCDESHLQYYVENRRLWNTWAHDMFIHTGVSEDGALERDDKSCVSIYKYTRFTYVLEGNLTSLFVSPDPRGFAFYPALTRDGHLTRVLVHEPLFRKVLSLFQDNAKKEDIWKTLNNVAAMTTYIDSLTKQADKSNPLGYSESALPDLVNCVLTALMVFNDIIVTGESSLSSWRVRILNSLFNSDIAQLDLSKLFTQLSSFPKIGLCGSNQSLFVRSRFSNLFSSMGGCLARVLSKVTRGNFKLDRTLYVKDAATLTRVWNTHLPCVSASSVRMEDVIATLCPWRRAGHRPVRTPVVFIDFEDCVHAMHLFSNHDELDRFLADAPERIAQWLAIIDREDTKLYAAAEAFVDELCVPDDFVSAPLGIVTQGVGVPLEREHTEKSQLKNAVGELSMIQLAAKNKVTFVYTGSSARGSTRTDLFIRSLREDRENLPAGVILCDPDSQQEMYDACAAINKIVPCEVVNDMPRDDFIRAMNQRPRTVLGDFKFSDRIPRRLRRHGESLRTEVSRKYPPATPLSPIHRFHISVENIELRECDAEFTSEYVGDPLVDIVFTWEHYVGKRGDGHESALFTLSVRLDPVTNPSAAYVLYDDAMVTGADHFRYCDIHGKSLAFSRKVPYMELGDTVLVHRLTPCGKENFLHKMFFGSSLEMRQTAVANADLDCVRTMRFLSLAEVGAHVKVYEIYDGLGRSYAFKTSQMAEDLQSSPLFITQTSATQLDAFDTALSIGLITGCATVQKHLVLLKKNFTQIPPNETFLGTSRTFPVPADFQRNRWHHVPGKFLDADRSVLNEELAQAHMFKLFRSSSRENSKFRHEFSLSNPLAELSAKGKLTNIIGVAGCGKSHALRLIAHRCFMVSPYKAIVNQTKHLYYRAYTFEVGVFHTQDPNFGYEVIKKPNGKEVSTRQRAIDYAVVEESHAMGGLLHYYADIALHHGLHLIMLGDPFQIHWGLRDANCEGPEKARTFEIFKRKLEYLCKPKYIFSGPLEFSNESMRYSQAVADVVGKMLNIQLIGHKEEFELDYRVFNGNIGDYLMNAEAMPIFERGVQYLTLTQSAAEEISSFKLIDGKNKLCVSTVAEAGGCNYDHVVLFLIPDSAGTPMPHLQEYGGVMIPAHAYVGFTRAMRKLTVVMPTSSNPHVDTTLILGSKLNARPYTPPPVQRCEIHLDALPVTGLLSLPVSGNSKLGNSFDARKRTFKTSSNILYRTTAAQTISAAPGERLLVAFPRGSGRSVDPAVVHQEDFIRDTVGFPAGAWWTDPNHPFHDLKRNALIAWRDAAQDGAVMLITEPSLGFDYLLPESEFRKRAQSSDSKPPSYPPRGWENARRVNDISDAILDARSASLVLVNDGVQNSTVKDPSTFLLPLGVIAPNYSISVPVQAPGAALSGDDGPKYFPTENSAFNSDYTTGQFHRCHQQSAAELVSQFFTLNPSDGAVVYHGPYMGEKNERISDLLDSYQGHSMVAKFKPQLAKEFGPTDYQIFTLNPMGSTGIYQIDDFFSQYHGALSRYGLPNYDEYIRNLPMGKRLAALGADYELIESVAVAFSSLCKPLTVDDLHDCFAKHAVEFVFDQNSKGSLYRAPDILDLLKPPCLNTHSMKTQMKHPDGPETAEFGLHKRKCGQPVQVGNPAHLNVKAPTFRVFTEIIHRILGPNLFFMGPGKTLDDLVEQFRSSGFNYKNAYGGDVVQCDASHMVLFRLFIFLFFRFNTPNLDSGFIDWVLQCLEEAMDCWFYSTRDGSIKGSVWGQLASGEVWTFILNCLWTSFNTFLMIITRLPKLKNFSGVCLAAAGDDCYFCLPDGFSLTPGPYITHFLVTLKISFEPHATIFCHHKMTSEIAALDPIRMLGKFLSKPLEPTEKCMLELRNALNALCCRYRDYNRIMQLKESYRIADPERGDACLPALDLIFRICNTPSEKLIPLLIEQKVRFVYRN